MSGGREEVKRPRLISSSWRVIDLKSFDTFQEHPWVVEVLEKFRHKDAVLAEHACLRIANDLMKLNEEYFEKCGRVAFTHIQSRVKSEESVLHKLHKLCSERTQLNGLTQESVKDCYDSIKDICGVRVSCPYLDEIRQAISYQIRPRLTELGYASDLSHEPMYRDEDLLDYGDAAGYRSLHFYVRVPAIIDIFGTVEHVLCEVQVRSELQHFWADKSHDLLYKPVGYWEITDEHVLEDMRQLSNLLRSVDQLIISIRDRSRGNAKT